MIAHIVLVDSQSIQRVAVPEILPLVSLCAVMKASRTR